MSKQISIIGCGWLGLPLANYLIDENFSVKGSTTSLTKIPNLKSHGIDASYVELTQDKIKGDIEQCLSGSEILVLNIPPGLRKDPEANFMKQISLLIPCIEKSSIKKVIFISSTSVYKDEESIPIITEDTIPNPDTESGRQILEVEKRLQNNGHFSTTIIRFSGLFGDNRHPAKYLSGKTDVKNPNAPVNLIHRDDCIGIIYGVIKNECWNHVFNASTIPQPSRKHYYTSICKEMGLVIPTFENTTLNKGKRINSEKVEQLLNYEFQVKLNN